jgi:hypothetical protein
MNKSTRIQLLVLLAATLLAFPLLTTKAFSQSGYYTSQGCSGCHLTTPTTCNGCHAHGTHPSSAKSSINVAGATNKASYAPGETVSVTITGGYKSGWFRAVLLNQNSVEIARSTGNDSGMGSSTTYPATLSAPAPATPGTYTWKVGWYGNMYDKAGAAFGAGWTPDATNPDHGYEIVSTNSFTVAAAVAAPTISTVSPNSLAQGAASQSVTITGTNLTGGTVSFSNPGVSGGAATVSATSITLPVSVTASAATGAGTVTVTTVGGSISSAFTVTATQNQLSVTLSGAGSGSVTSSPAGISCISGSATGCASPFDATASVILTESASNGSLFAGWGGDCSSFGSSASCTLSMAAARNVTAAFNAANSLAMINTTGYPTLSMAYSSAAGGATIMLMDSNIVGDLTVDKDIVLDGGYDASFTAKTGQPTTLSGILTVTTGTLTAADIAVM